MNITAKGIRIGFPPRQPQPQKWRAAEHTSPPAGVLQRRRVAQKKNAAPVAVQRLVRRLRLHESRRSSANYLLLEGDRSRLVIYVQISVA
jgi:hypothetical protein